MLIIIPTLNNLDYLKLCIKSLESTQVKSSNYLLNIGEMVLIFEKENIEYTFTNHNAGICEGMNMASKKAKNDFILYAHDDFYFLPKMGSYIKK